MGEIADAMINGLFCEQCGELIDGDEPGYPRTCEGCSAISDDLDDDFDFETEFPDNEE